ncbi:MAG: hypothetical protein RR543_05935, partial [Erysipelotrichales bacterium]
MKELKRGLSLFTFLMVVLFGYNISAANIIEVNDVNTLKSTLENTSCASNSIIEIKSNLNFNDIEGKDKDISIKCENVIIKGEEGKDIELKAADGYRHFKNDAKNAGLTIDNLTFSLNDSASFGGGILYLNESADLNIKNATFKGIIGKYYSYGDARNMKGSAIESNKSNILIENSKFLDNVGENTSGTVSNMSGNVVINNSSFKGNILLDTISPSAVRAKDAQISNSEFIGNISKASSGMGPLQTTTFNINNTLFKDNIATDKAGAMFAGGAGVVKNSSFINNKAAKTGGAIAAGTKPIEVINSTFVNNEANTGSAIEYAQGLILKQSTVVSNKASTTGSALNGGKDAGILNMYGSIVVGNIAGDKEVNLIEKNETKWVNKPEHHNLINQENDDIKLDAIFNLNDGNVVVEENEKFTPTINLKNDTSNPALDKIQTNAEWLTGDLLKDQLGVTRPQNDLTDIGASELVVKLSEDQIKAKEIDNKINALPQADKLTKADLEKTKAALKEYDDASNEVKSFVSETTKTKIEALKVKVAELDKDDDSQIKEEMQKVLDEKYTLNRLTDMVSEKTIDPNNVMNDVQLLSPKDLGVDNYQDYNFYVTSDSDNLKIDSFTSSDGTIKISYFRMYVYRPLEPEQHKDAKFKVTMYNRKANNVSVSKEFDIKIKPLTNKEIDKEVKFMDAVKADYFNGINQGINKDKDNIDKDMKNFHFALKDNDKVKWSYVTPNGTDNKFNYEDSIRHVRNGAPKKGDEFFSSNEDVIEHDKLIVHRPAKDTKVTISSTLTSHIYAKYADKYPEDQRFAQLKNQKVSVELFVLGSDEEQETREPQSATI